MSCAKFRENQSRIYGEINEKHALQIIVSQTIDYSCSQLPPALGVFRRFLIQFLIFLLEILQALFTTILALTQKIS